MLNQNVKLKTRQLNMRIVVKTPFLIYFDFFYFATNPLYRAEQIKGKLKEIPTFDR